MPAPRLTNEERRLFEVGDSFFTQNWVSAPASTDARDGLGPTFNGQACSSCHIRDGRGSPPDPNDEKTNLGLLFRLSIPEINPATQELLGDPNYGNQLQDRAILGVTPEGEMNVSYTEVSGTYEDGTPYSLRKPSYKIANLAFGPLSEELFIGPRLAPQIIGVGLLETIPEERILSLADPEDQNGDGISGRANMVWDSQQESLMLGRFGWKANISTVREQVAAAFSGDIGITSSLRPDTNCPEIQGDCLLAPNGGSPELPDERLDAVTFYTKTLSIPAMRDHEQQDVIAGFEHFNDFGCSSCHSVTHTTGPSSIAALSNQVIHPYTDLLLHDMGEGLADGRPDFLASGREWRTPPLWGLGLIENINGARFLLHDGRARTLEEAILWHGGEALASQGLFKSADIQSRNELLAFLEAL